MSSASVVLGSNILTGGGGGGGVTEVDANAPLSVINPTTIPTISITQASTDTDGYLSQTDWNTFNNKFDLPSLGTGDLLFSDGSTISNTNTNLVWDNTNCTLTVTNPSTISTLQTVLTVTSDPAGDHGYGNHIAIDGNPGGGGTIFRTDGGGNRSWIQIYGGDTATDGGGLYVNGNNSTGGDAGGVQITFGLSSSTFDIYDYTESFLLFQVQNNGNVLLPYVTASRALVTDSSNNLTASATTATEIGYVSGVTSSIQDQLNNTPYSPANPSYWDSTPPSTVQQALDRMASLLYTLNSNTPIP